MSANAERVEPSLQPSLLLAELLHDEVLSEIRLAVLRLELLGPAGTEAREELLKLEHRLRFKCVEQRALEGRVTADEVVDLQCRQLHALGIEVTVDVGERGVLAPETVRDLHHCLTVLVANAAQAGATRVGIAVRGRRHAINVTVTDNAGGFDLEQVPHGRGLSTIREAWGEDSVKRRGADGGGSTVTIRLPRGARVSRA